MPRLKGKFWPYVRPQIWEKAQQLYQEEQARTMGSDFKGITATKRELREGSYFHRAKIIVLSNLYRQKKGLPTIEEEELTGQYGEKCLRYSEDHSSRKSEKDRKPKPDEPASVNTKSVADTESAAADSEGQKPISLLNADLSRSLEK